MYGSVEPTLDDKGLTDRDPLGDKAATVGDRQLDNKKQQQPLFCIVATLSAILIGIVAVSFSGKILMSPNSSPAIVSQNATSAVSQRGSTLKAVRDDISLFMKGIQDAYHPTDNPHGYLVMLVAENKLMWKEMAQKLEQVQASNPLPSWIFNYGDMGGEDGFKQSMADMMQHWIQAPVNKTYLRFQDGAGSVLGQIAFALTDPGDGVLTPAPGYIAFEADFGMYTGAKLHWISTRAEKGYVPTEVELNEGYDRSVAAGNPPRILIICQPQNPTGVVYSKSDMEFMMNWALDKGLHVVSDEIYALSTFPGYQTTSAADIMREKSPDSETYLGDRVHVVAGLSKDWGMSGFRVGSLFTHNAQLLTAIDTIGYYQSVSRYTQFALTGVFSDHDFVSWYIEENRRRLYETYQALKDALDLIQVPLFPSQGAIFAWADFSSYILDGQSEKELWMELFNDAKIALTSGESCIASKPGMFRIVYGWPEGGTVAMKELGHRLVKWKAHREAKNKQNNNQR